MKRQKKQPDWDDGRTVANMNVEGMPWYHPDSGKKVREEDKPTRKEKRAMIRAAYLVYNLLYLHPGRSQRFFWYGCTRPRGYRHSRPRARAW